ncbi:retroelement silencing factor 1 [Acomys russatus]|uniref:retroelement silencing factor 1 n=1 Tax=Acomys russatus TaxID=60746 RepID=UPI0021E326C4|nr:retroelement silencing factor 1 [Acomys russatus]
MNWNVTPESAAKAPSYSKSQSILQQFLMTPTASQSSFSYPAINQEACMYPTNSNSASQPPLNGRSYLSPQSSVSNVHNRTAAASQSSLQRVTCANVKGPQQQNHNLQTVSSGAMPNGWLNPSVRSFMPSHTEAGTSHNPGGGTNMPYMHAPQSPLVPLDSCSVQLQMTPSNSLKVPITYQGNYQGNQGLTHSVNQPDQLVAWTQCTSNELTYPEYRPPPKQCPYSPQTFVPSTTSLQVKNNQFSTYTQALQTKLPVPVSSYQCAAETNKGLSTLPHSCRYGSPHVQNSQLVNKQLSLEVPQSSEMHSPEKKKDPYRGFKQQWQQNTKEKINTIGKFCELKINTKPSYNESVGSSGDGIQTFLQNNQEKRKYSYNPNTNQAIDTNVTKEKLVRDIKSLVEIKKKFSELARKIKINKGLLMAAGCSKTANTSYIEPTQPSEFSTREMSAKSDNHCSMELLATCLSLWKNQPPKTTGENVPKPVEEKDCNTSRASAVAVGSSGATEEVGAFCLGVGGPQKMMSSSQTALPVLTLSYDSSVVAVGKATELQIAVVSPLVLSDTSALPGKELAAQVLPETVYPVVKEGSVRSLQDQQAETALPFDGTGALASSTISAEVSVPAREHKPTQGDPGVVDSSLIKTSSLGAEALPNPRDSTAVSAPMLQIESICSLAEGDVSYNSQIAEIFSCVQNEPLKPSPNQVINSQQEQVDTTENKDFSFQKDKCVQLIEAPHEVTEQPEPLQPLEPALCDYAEANREILEESCKEHPGGKESTAKDMCSSAAVQQDTHPQETDEASSLPAVSDVHDENEPVSYLHDQLSELLREFPYGIETVPRHKVSVDQQKTHEILENQTGIKTGNMSGDSTDQIKITVLNSEQIKELFPEEDQACDLDTSEEPENKKGVEGAKSPCDSQALREENPDPGELDLEKDTIHCCALGWLSMVYEGVPQCRCGSTEKERKDQSSSDLNSCKQKEQSCDSGITVFEINPVSNNPNTPLAEVPEKGHFSEMHGEKIKTSKTEDSSSPGVEQELNCDFLINCYKDRPGTLKIEHVSSQKTEQKLTNVSPKCDTPNPSKSNKATTPKIFHVITSNSDKNTPSFSKQVSQESQQKKQMSQDSGPVKAHVRLLPNKDLCRRNNSSTQSVSPEKKKFKFKAGGSRLRYFEKRKRDHVISPDMYIKKKKYEKQEQDRNAGGTLKLCSTLTGDPKERASVKEKTVPSSESLDSKGSCSKSARVITVQEYLQRQKDKRVTGNKASKNTCVENVPCDSEHLKSSKHSALASSVKLVEGQRVSAEASKEPEHSSTTHGKSVKTHHAEESRTHAVSSKGKLGWKKSDKNCIDKKKLERSISSESSQVKEQRKQYLNRVAFKCTEQESICLTKLDSGFKKLSKEGKKSTAYVPRMKDTDKPSMLEFKLCPDVILRNTSSVDKQDAPKPGPGKEQAPLQVSGIKSTKEDWLKCIPTRTKMLESSQETDRAASRLSKRSLSANEFETLQNPVKDSDVMFRTYKKMYLEKRSRSLGSSPVK